MTDDKPLLPSTLRDRRERKIEALTAHFAADRIDADEFEKRVDLVYRAGTLQEIEAVGDDLPALPAASLPGGTMLPALASPGDVRERQMVIAVMGGTDRKGAWSPARQINVLALMGGVELDFREARFAPGVTELSILAMMGGVEVVVPPGLRVESEGFGLLGGFEGLDQEGAALDDPGQPVLRIRGVAIMGGVEVTERLPGETPGDRRRRLRAQRQGRGRLGPGG